MSNRKDLHIYEQKNRTDDAENSTANERDDLNQIDGSNDVEYEGGDTDDEKLVKQPIENWRNKGTEKAASKKTRAYRSQSSILNRQVNCRQHFFENFKFLLTKYI